MGYPKILSEAERGNFALTTEQQQVIAIARNLGLQRTEYFDAYVEEYDFTWQLRSPHMITPVTPNGNFIYTTR